MWYYWYSIILFFFPSFPEFHRLVSLLQKCNWVCIWSCLFLYICLSLVLSTMYERKHVSFVFLILANFSLYDVLHCIHLPSNSMSLFLVYMYHKSWSIH
jgi:hypothetical protein